MPDLTVFLDVRPEVAARRGGYGGERYEVPEMQRRVRELFRVLREEEVREGKGRWAVVDAGREEGVVRGEVVGLVRGAVEEVRRSGKGVGKYWVEE